MRNSMRASFPIWRNAARLLSATSSVRRFGPMKSPRPVLPNVPAGCSTNATRVEPLLWIAGNGAFSVEPGRIAWPVAAEAGTERRLPEGA
ncbi:hypothetical protein D3C83_81870 [compost metagenome]